MQKHEKCLKSKNDIKRRLGAINQSYEQILNLRIWKFKSYFPHENGSLLIDKAKLLMEKGSQPHRNIEKFFIVLSALHTALHT